MARVEELSFPELVQELVRFEHEAGPPDLERALRRRSVDARLMRLLSTDAPADERRGVVRVPGALPVKLLAEEATLLGTIVDLCEGGLRVKLPAAPDEIGTVEVELELPERPARATARVTWRSGQGEEIELGLCFVAQPETHRRRMRHLVIELLRKLPVAT